MVLTSAGSKYTTVLPPKKRQISSLQNENESLLTTNEEIKVATEESAEKERKGKSELR
jgi:hypothetical protein